MPRERQFTVLEQKDGGAAHPWQTRVVAMKDGETTVDVNYVVPADANAMKSLVASLTGDALESLYDSLVRGVDIDARQQKREASMANSTEIMVNGQKIDIYEYPVPKLVNAINGYRQVEQLTGKEIPNAFKAAARKLIEEKKAAETDGVLVAA